MTRRDYLYAAVLCLGRPYDYINTAKSIKWRHVLLHFMLIFCLLFIPVFTQVARTPPDQIYARMYGLDFENAAVRPYPAENFSAERLDESRPAIYIFDDFTAYVYGGVALSAPSSFFGPDELSRPFGEVFSMLAVYNLYIPQFLLPLLLAVFLILLALQLFFYVTSALFLGLVRLSSRGFPFGERIRIVVLSSLAPSLPCMAAGFFLPAVHIILFQMLNLLLLFHLSKRYDKKERELYLREEN